MKDNVYYDEKAIKDAIECGKETALEFLNNVIESHYDDKTKTYAIKHIEELNNFTESLSSLDTYTLDESSTASGRIERYFQNTAIRYPYYFDIETNDPLGEGIPPKTYRIGYSPVDLKEEIEKRFKCEYFATRKSKENPKYCRNSSFSLPLSDEF